MSKTGEIGAIGGYHTQYSIAAWEIYYALLDESLEWIRLGSQTSGNLDDVLIGLSDRILACQVKDKTGTFSYHSLVNNTDQLLVKMYKGWVALSKEFPGKAIDVKLITTQAPSENDTINAYSGSKKPNFANFYKNFWCKIRKGQKISTQWNKVIEELSQLLNCSEDDLFSFIRATSFSFNKKMPDEQDFNAISWPKVKAGADRIKHFIFDSIGKERKSIQLDYNEFVDKIGFRRRLQTYFQHDFFIDEKHYQPIVQSMDKLKSIVSKYESGYIALTGSAGSGKSTLLSKWLEGTSNRVLKYYAYVNRDMTYDSGYRGESKYFLHDLITQIYLNLGSREMLPSENRIDLAAELGNELNRLASDYRENGSKTFIIIDGLDHIEREQKVEYSLLKDLPDPARIPAGVYFIVGSRTIDGLKDLNINIKLNISKEERSVEIDPLNKVEVSLIVNSYSDIILNDPQIDNLFVNTLGHPLFLRYTIEKLLSSESGAFDSVIAEQQFTGNINDEYDKFWISVREDDSFIKLLGIIARFRFSFIEIDMLEKGFGFSSSTLSKFLLQARYFFTIPEKGKWQYFHNSFKWFLEHQSALQILSGIFDSARDEKFHQQITQAIQHTTSNYRWNLVYHLFKSKQFAQILSIANQDFFRNQWFEFRNLRLIKEDIAIAARAAYFEKSIPGMTRYIFAAAEIGQRINNFRPDAHYPLYLYLGMYDVADDYIIEGKELLVDKRTALEYAMSLRELGKETAARQVFNLAEPNFILYHSKEVDTERYSSFNYSRTDEVELIVKWSTAAIAYYPFKKIVSLLENLEVVDHRYDETGDEVKKKKSLRLGMIVKSVSEIISECFSNNRPEIVLEALQYALSLIGKHKALLEIYFSVFSESGYIGRADYQKLINYCVDQVNAWGETNDPDSNLYLSLLHVYHTGDMVAARTCFEKLPLPLKTQQDMFHRASNNMDYLFDYAKLFFVLTNKMEKDLLELLSKTKDGDENVLYHYIVSIAFYYSQVFFGNPAAISDITVSLKNILLFFHKDFLEMSYSVRELKNEVIGLVTNLTHKVSQTVYLGIIDTIAEDWQTHTQYWRGDQMRMVINKVANDPDLWEWCTHQLHFVETKMLLTAGPYERTEECMGQAYAWKNVGNSNKVLENLKNAFKQTLGIGNEKDYQLDYLVKWLDIMAMQDPANRKERLNWFIERLPFLQDTARNSHGSIVTAILNQCLKWFPGDAVSLCRWLLLERMIDFSESVEMMTTHCCQNDPDNADLYAKVFTHILLFFQDNSNYGHKLIPLLVKGLGSTEKLTLLIDEINQFAIEEKREDIIKKIIGAAKDYNIPLSVTAKKLSADSNRRADQNQEFLVLASGEKLSYEELIDKIKHPHELIAFMRNEKEKGNFHWERLLPLLKITFTEPFLREIQSLMTLDAADMGEFAMMVHNKGFDTLAREIAYNALEKSKTAGWIQHYDGGSKIKPYQVLRHVEDTNTVKELVLKDLAFNFKELGAKQMIDDIIPILSIMLPDNDNEYLTIYQEIENYIHALFATSSIEHNGYKFKDNIDSVHDRFVNFFVFIFEFPVASLREHLETIMISCFPQSSDLVHIFTDKLYQHGEVESFLNILNGISLNDLHALDQYKNQIHELTAHGRFDIADGAIALLARLGITVEQKHNNSPLPLTYVMEFDTRPELIIDKEVRIKRIEEEGSLRETNDPIEFIGFYGTAARALSHETNIKLLNIAHRIMQLAKEEHLPDWYDPFTEKQLSGFLDAIGLKTAYARPRMRKLLPALMRVVKELWNSGKISLTKARLYTDCQDPSISKLAPSHRPPFVVRLINNHIDRDARHYDLNEKWVESLDNKGFNQLTFVQGEDYILAESSFIKFLSDGRPTEIRKSFITEQPNIDTTDHLFFQSGIYNCLIDEYSEYDERELILANYVHSFDQRRMWLAINPLVCHIAGWQLADDGLFRWVDRQGQTMVESFYWIDGNTMTYQRLFESEGGYGWYVIASKKALKSLMEIIEGPIYLQMKIERSYKFQQKKYNTDIDSRKSIFDTTLVDLKL